GHAPFFDQRHQERTSASKDIRRIISGQNRFVVRLAADGRVRANDSNPAVPGPVERRARSRQDDAKDGHIKITFESGQRPSRRRGPRDYGVLDILLEQKLSVLAAKSYPRAGRFRPERNPRRTPKKDHTPAGKSGVNLTNPRQTADAGIKHS